MYVYIRTVCIIDTLSGSVCAYIEQCGCIFLREGKRGMFKETVLTPQLDFN